MKNQTHIIKKQILDLTLDSSVGSFALQSKAGEFLKREILPELDAYCDEIACGDGIIRIDRLEIDLGVISKKNFEREFKKKFGVLFPEKLEKIIGNAGFQVPFWTRERDGSVERPLIITKEAREFEILEYFISEGQLPWWAEKGLTWEITALIEQTVTQQPAKLKKFMDRVLDHSVIRKRLVYYSNDPSIKKILALFMPHAYEEILEMAQILIELMADYPLTASINPSTLKSEIFSAVLTQAAIFQGQALNRRLLLEGIIKCLSVTFGMDCDSFYGYIVGNTSLSRTAIKGGKLLMKDIREIVKQRDEPVSSRDSAKNIHLETGADPLASKNDTAALENRLAGLLWLVMAEEKESAYYLRQMENIHQFARKFHQVVAQTQNLTETSTLKESLLRTKIAGVLESVRHLGQKLHSVAGEADRNRPLMLKPAMEKDLKTKIAGFEKELEKLLTDLALILDRREFAPEGEPANSLIELDQSLHRLKEIAGYRKELPPSNSFSASEELFIGNAGLILLWPYLSNFFETLGLLKNNDRFITEEAQERAAFLLQYLVGTGEKLQEYEMALPKLLCGMEPRGMVNPFLTPTPAEGNEGDKLLQAVIRNWAVLKNLSVANFQKMFLQREGMIFNRDGHPVLKIAEKAYDVLVDRLPWGIGLVKLPWMAELVMVEWRM